MAENLMFILGIIAILQSLVVPGMMILKYLKFKGNFIQTMVYTVALSLVSSYFIVLVLVLLKIYNQFFLILFFIFEVGLLIWLYRQELKESFGKIFIQIWKNFTFTFHNLFASWKEANTFSSVIYALITLFTFALSLVVLWWAIKIINHYAGTIFTAWDAVVSWNKWALVWADGIIPLVTRNYPQLVPANYSLSYVFMGNTSIQFFSKFLVLPMAFLILSMLFDLGVQTKKNGFFIGAIITYLLLKKFLEPELTNGYVDGTMAFFSLLPVYTLVKALYSKSVDEKRLHVFIGAVFAGSAALVKQSGLYIFAIYPFLAYFGVLKPLSWSYIKLNRKAFLSALGISFLIALPWYMFKQLIFIRGLDRPEISILMEESYTANYSLGLYNQIISSFSQFEKYLILFPLVFAAAFFLKPLYRTLIFSVVLPYPFLWAIIASYDTRNLSLLIPLLGLTAGLSAEWVIDISLKAFDFLRLASLKFYIIMMFFLIVLFSGLTYLYPSSVIYNNQLTLQKQMFSAAKNEMIYQLVAQEGSEIRILTNYPIQDLPGLDGIQVRENYKSYDSFIGKITNPQIEYLLVPEDIYIDPRVDVYINEKIEKGEYEVVFEDSSWKYYRMIRIRK